MNEELLKTIHKVALRSCRILFLCADMLDPKRKSISQRYLSEPKTGAEELQKRIKELL